MLLKLWVNAKVSSEINSIDTYELIEKVGEGGFGEVYKAIDKDGRIRAVKIALPEAAEQLRREVTLDEKLSHPSIVEVYDFNPSAERPYIVREFVDGESLHEKLERDGRLSIEESIEITQKVLEALDYAHSQNVLHRDIKPSNILLGKEEEVKVSDFGLGKLLEMPMSGYGGESGSGLIKGTVAYMSPEQRIGKPATKQSDIYSAGAVLFEMITGQIPGVESLRELRPEVSEELGEVAKKALSSNPKERYQSVGEFMSALEDTFLEDVVEFTREELEVMKPGAGPIIFPHISIPKEIAQFSIEVELAKTLQEATEEHNSSEGFIPNNPQTNFINGLSEYFKGNYGRAFEHFREIENHPLSFDDILLMGTGIDSTRVYLFNPSLGEPKLVLDRALFSNVPVLGTGEKVDMFDPIHDFALLDGKIYDGGGYGVFETGKNKQIFGGGHFYCLLPLNGRLYASGHEIYDIFSESEIADREDPIPSMVTIGNNLFDASEAGVFETLTGRKIFDGECFGLASLGGRLYASYVSKRDPPPIDMSLEYQIKELFGMKDIAVRDMTPHLAVLKGQLYDRGGHSGTDESGERDNLIETLTGRELKFGASNVLVASDNFLYSDEGLTFISRFDPSTGTTEALISDFGDKLKTHNSYISLFPFSINNLLDSKRRTS